MISSNADGLLGASDAISATAQSLLPLFYDDVRRMARRERRAVNAGGTLQTTALIHEAYLRLRNQVEFNDQTHFLRAAALAMRHALLSHVRARLATKRGGGAEVLPLDAAEDVVSPTEQLLLDINESLQRLAEISPRLAQVVECRFFAGYDESETARALNISQRTVSREWVKARAWLRRELAPDQSTWPL